MATPEIRFDRVTLFWRSAAVVFVARQLLVLGAIARLVPPPFRMRALLFGRWTTQRSVVVALMGAAAVTLLTELAVRLVVAPLLRFWLNPRVDHTAGLFQIAASEWIVSTTPARRRQGRRWEAGTLARTNRRAWFFPDAWDSEPWSVGLDELPDVRFESIDWLALGFLKGLPPRLVIGADGNDPEVFALSDPESVAAWFEVDEPAPVLPDPSPSEGFQDDAVAVHRGGRRLP